MILDEEVKAKFKEYLGEIPEWKNLVDSQFVEKMAVFVGWLVEHAHFSVERAYQEAFYDSALNRSSLLAHAEGLSYVSAKPEPATGQAPMGQAPTTMATEPPTEPAQEREHGNGRWNAVLD